MNCLVTGANGFLGRYVVEQLVARGDRVRVLIRRPDEDLAALGVKTVVSDLLEAEKIAAACSGIDAVFHVAGKAGIGGPWHDFYVSNVVGTKNVIAACRQQNVPRLIFTSSPSVTFDGRDQCGIDESAPYPTRWLCYYPRTKALAEQAVLAANNGTSLVTCALRPHLIWGPRDRHLIPRLLERARAGQLRRVGDGQNLIDTSYVENAAQAHLQAADALTPNSPVAGKAYFLSQGEPVNCWNWIGELMNMAGLPPLKKSISARTAYAAGTVLEMTHRLFLRSGEPRMTRFLAAQLSTSHYFNISSAGRDFHYEPKISTLEGMRRLAASWA